MENRTCSKCGTEKPLETGYYRNPNSRGGWTAHCRACHKRRPRKPPRAPEGFKKCTACGEIKAATADHWHLAAKGKYGLAARCRPCKLIEIARVNTPEKKAAYYEANKVEIIASQQRRMSAERRESPARLRAYFAKWRADNRDAYRAMMRVGSANRRARKSKAGGKCSTAEIEKMKVGQRGLCWWCQKPYGRYHVDHRIPLAAGGGSGANNLVISCGPCNIRKNARMPWQIDNPRLL